MKTRYAVFGQGGMRLGYVESISLRGARGLASRIWVRWRWIEAVATLAKPDEAFYGRAIGAMT